MQAGFPIDLLTLVRCCIDAGELKSASLEPIIVDGSVQCAVCSREYSIAQGILKLLGPRAMHPESLKEQRVRDVRNQAVLDGTRPEWSSRLSDAVEVAPTLRALALVPGVVVNELGCGAGRYTLALARVASAVVAVDFSVAGLLVIREKLEPSARVALVQADVTEPYGAPRAFDRVLSTLHSNLPGRDHRMASLRHVANTLADRGRAVISMHHYSVRDVLLGVPAAGRYPGSGIYRYHMTGREARRESLPFFERLRFTHVGTVIPRVNSAAMARAAGRVPLLRSALSQLLLGVVEGPRRPPDVDHLAGTTRFVARLARLLVRRQVVAE